MTKYFSSSKGKHIEVESMTDQHVRNAFIKLIKHNELVENELSETLENLELHVDQNKYYVNMLMEKAKESTSVKGHRYVFSDIPNDPDGEYFVEQLRKYLNKDTYEMRVRGQYLRDGLNWRQHTYGQSIENSKCLRIYVEKK
tara:strand:+ start:153 stop:578 length:426 start_codon:yes stop_codon:yes gene_type:complete